MPSQPTDSLLGQAVLYLVHMIETIRLFLQGLTLEEVKSYVLKTSSTLYLTVKSYITSIEMSDDSKMALQIGVTMGVCIMTFLVSFEFSNATWGFLCARQRRASELNPSWASAPPAFLAPRSSGDVPGGAFRLHKG